MRTKKITKEHIGQTLTVKGWVRTIRVQKSFSFIELNDGSEVKNFQIVVLQEMPNYEMLIEHITTGASLAVTGTIVASPNEHQSFELQAKEIEIIGLCPIDKYPLQKKRHSLEYLRTIAHLRPRTNTIGAVMRVRNRLAFSIHQFFQERDFIYLHSPIITASDCEGAGQLFQVTTLDLARKDLRGEVDYTQDFFGKKAFLTVSGQLNGEIMASALSDIYTFGPTFRAENSNTSRHLAEFWMIEPEIAFADLQDNLALAEAFIKRIFGDLLKYSFDDLKFFDQFIKKGVIQELENLCNKNFTRITYTEAISILEKAPHTFQFPVKWGLDLQSEHERYLTEKHFQAPIFVTDYPREIKAFYMRQNDDAKTVAAMDMLVPGIGEIIGGSQREERLDVLKNNMDRVGLNKEPYWWYLELREFGTHPHAGFGAGFERLIQFATGMENIRDVIAFPRYPGHAEF